MKLLLDTLLIELTNNMQPALEAVGDLEDVHGVLRPADGKVIHLMATAALEAYKKEIKWGKSNRQTPKDDFDTLDF
jgi:hypothetical protein